MIKSRSVHTPLGWLQKATLVVVATLLLGLMMTAQAQNYPPEVKYSDNVGNTATLTGSGGVYTGGYY